MEESKNMLFKRKVDESDDSSASEHEIKIESIQPPALRARSGDASKKVKIMTPDMTLRRNISITVKSDCTYKRDNGKNKKGVLDLETKKHNLNDLSQKSSISHRRSSFQISINKKQNDRGMQTDTTRIESVRERFFPHPFLRGTTTILSAASQDQLQSEKFSESNEKSIQTEAFYVDSPTPSMEFDVNMLEGSVSRLRSASLVVEQKLDPVQEKEPRPGSNSVARQSSLEGHSINPTDTNKSILDLHPESMEENVKNNKVTHVQDKANTKNETFSISECLFSETTCKESYLVSLFQELPQKNNSNSNDEIGEGCTNIRISRLFSRKRFAISVEEPKDLAPQDAINKIKDDCWDSELLLLIIPYNSDTINEADVLEVHAIDKIYSVHKGSFCFPKEQLINFEKAGILKKYHTFLLSKYLNIYKELKPIIQYTRYLTDRNCFSGTENKIENMDKNSLPAVSELFKKFDCQNVRSNELRQLFQLASEKRLKIYARPNYSKEDNLYNLEFFTENSNYLGTVSAKEEIILKLLESHKGVLNNFDIILDHNELALPNVFRKILYAIAGALGLMYLYNRFKRLFFHFYKQFT